MKRKKTTIVARILWVLVIISVVQAFQLNSVKEEISGGQLSVSTPAGSAPPASSAGAGSKKTAGLPSSIKDLPQMVGGC